MLDSFLTLLSENRLGLYLGEDKVGLAELKEAEQILSKLNVIGMIVNGGITLDENFDLDFDKG